MCCLYKLTCLNATADIQEPIYHNPWVHPHYNWGKNNYISSIQSNKMKINATATLTDQIWYQILMCGCPISIWCISSSSAQGVIDSLNQKPREKGKCKKKKKTDIIKYAT